MKLFLFFICFSFFFLLQKRFRAILLTPCSAPRCPQPWLYTERIPWNWILKALKCKKWNILTDTAQRVDEKDEVICLAIMFTLGVLWSLKYQKWYIFCISYGWRRKLVTVRAKCLSAPERSYWVLPESGRLMWFGFNFRKMLRIEI